MRSSNGASEPRAASVDKAPADQGRPEGDFGLEQTGQGIGRRELRAV